MKYPNKLSFWKLYRAAIQNSTMHPDTVYTILDKPHKQCILHTVEWAVDQHILDGWHTVCRIQNGKEV